MWERTVEHSVLPSFDDGFLLPYHQLLADRSLQGTDLAPFIALVPGDHFEEFSYVTERVGDDGAIAALTELARVVDLLPGVVDGPWTAMAAWIADRLAIHGRRAAPTQGWAVRSPPPGLSEDL